MSSQPKRLLLAEDDAGVRLIAEELLRTAGYQVVSVGDGVHAGSALERLTPDLILSDVRMPRRNGFELLEFVRSRPETIHVPFIILSAKADTPDIQMGMSLGADDYVTKPFHPPDLLRTIEVRLARAAAIASAIRGHHRFLARTLPHELRTPLVGIIGYADLLAMTGASGQGITAAEAREFGENIGRSGERLLRTVEDFSLWATMESAQGAHRGAGRGPGLESAALQQLCEAVAEEYGRGADLTVRVRAGALPPAEFGLARILRHLVDNAFKFSLPESPVHVSWAATDRSWAFTVTDAGRGMTAAQRADAQALKQFERERYEQQGMGMGLTLARSLARTTGGKLTLAGGPGDRGLSVTLELPTCP